MRIPLVTALLAVACSHAVAATATDDAATASANAATLVSVLGNDSGTDIGITALGTPSSGTAAIVGTRILYRPAVGFSGSATIGYTIGDGRRHGTVRRGVLGQSNNTLIHDSGYGSALVPINADEYYLLTDRGPNIDGATSTEKVFPIPTYQPRIGRFARQSDGSFALVSTVLLTRPDGTTAISGLPNPANSTSETAKDTTGANVTYTPDTGVGAVAGQDTFGLDTEGMAIIGTDFWICDEYGPFVVKFNASGVEQERVSPLAVNSLGHSLPKVFARRRPNRGMEGLCKTPSGKLVGLMQNALRNSAAGTPHSNSVNNRTPTVRIVVYDPATGVSQQYVYLLTDPLANAAAGLRLSEIACINETKFLVIERDDAFATNGSTIKKIYEIDLSAATDISDAADRVTGRLYTRSSTVATVDTLEKFTESMDTAAAVTVLSELRTEDGLAAAPVVAVTKVERADLITLIGAGYNHDKIEGLAVLATTGVGAAEVATRIAIANDDDFGIGNGSVNYALAAKASSTGVTDHNEIAEIDLTASTSASATLTVTVAAQSPYLQAVASGVQTRTLLTVGDTTGVKPDTVTPYRMVGLPDGMGAFDNGDGTFTMLVNHELGSTAGIARQHGSLGAFVSKWTVSKSTLQVLGIQDLNQTNTSVFTWNGSAYVAGTTAYSRFCSGDLPAVSAFSSGSLGTTNRIYMAGEESTGGRVFAHVASGVDAGKSWQLPRLGRIAWETAVACPVAQTKTIVMACDDSGRIGQTPPSELNIYVGTKLATGLDVEKAGLTNGLLYGLKVTGKTVEDRNTTAPYGVGAAKGTPVAFTMAQYTTTNLLTDDGTALQAEAITNGVMQFSRVEDGAWNPLNPADFYFVSTDQFDQVKVGTGTTVGRTRLWRVRFTNIAAPESGGTITMMLDGTEAVQMMDNICIDRQGRIMLQEDVGGQAHNGKIWAYTIATGALTQVAKHDATKFGDLIGGVTTTATAPFNNDEEASGIIDASDILGTGWYLMNDQAHYAIGDTELAEGGQMLAMFVPSTVGAGSATGLSGSTAYIIPSTSGVQTRALMTVGESVNLKPDGVTPYRMVGIPDGLGAFDNSDGTFTLLMNHELGSTAGIARAHGSVGSFVSKWTINKSTLRVQNIQDFNQSATSINTWNGTAYVAGTTAYSRFCSGDLPATSAFLSGALGTSSRIYLAGEEGTGGRCFAHVVSGADAGKSWQLPMLGRIAWETAVACPKTQTKTIVMGCDDSGRIGQTPPSELNIYVGTKLAAGLDIEKAGLTNGLLYGLKVAGRPVEDRNTTAPYGLGAAKGTAVAFTMAQYTATILATDDGTALQAEAITNGVTQFSRVEDGAWDPLNPADFYFVSTDQFDQVKAGTGTTVGRSRLWRVRFTDIAAPETGGTITMLLDGTEATQMMDNICVDRQGRVMLQEDVGGNAHNGKIWSYKIATGTLTEVAKHDPARFGDLVGGVTTLPTAPFNNDEEASGIIDVSDILGTGWYLMDDQTHYTTTGDTELVEGGQLLAMFVPSNVGGTGGEDGTGGSGVTPYIVPVASGVKTQALMTVGESVNLKPDGITPYRMVGIPDGLGAFDNGNGTFSLLMNHELGSTAGIARAHGNLGSFVSKLTIRTSNLQVENVQDFNQTNTSINTWNGTAYVAGSTAYSRFCSGDLPAQSALASGAYGTTNRIYLTGEETTGGRLFAHVATGPDAGKSWELPKLGRIAWENAVACPKAQMKTIVMGGDDSDRVGGLEPSELNIYAVSYTHLTLPTNREV